MTNIHAERNQQNTNVNINHNKHKPQHTHIIHNKQIYNVISDVRLPEQAAQAFEEVVREALFAAAGLGCKKKHGVSAKYATNLVAVL